MDRHTGTETERGALTDTETERWTDTQALRLRDGQTDIRQKDGQTHRH